MNERSDTLAVRLTEVETNLQDATMDVSTAVQLDRMETIERALAELDPDQFVRKDGRDAPESATAPPGRPRARPTSSATPRPPSAPPASRPSSTPPRPTQTSR